MHVTYKSKYMSEISLMRIAIIRFCTTYGMILQVGTLSWLGGAKPPHLNAKCLDLGIGAFIG